MLIVLTNGFKRFETYKELCRSVGIKPVIRQSRTRAKEKNLHSLLFLIRYKTVVKNPLPYDENHRSILAKN